MLKRAVKRANALETALVSDIGEIFLRANDKIFREIATVLINERFEIYFDISAKNTRNIRVIIAKVER